MLITTLRVTLRGYLICCALRFLRYALCSYTVTRCYVWTHDTFAGLRWTTVGGCTHLRVDYARWCGCPHTHRSYDTPTPHTRASRGSFGLVHMPAFCRSWTVLQTRWTPHARDADYAYRRARPCRWLRVTRTPALQTRCTQLDCPSARCGLRLPLPHVAVLEQPADASCRCLDATAWCYLTVPAGVPRRGLPLRRSATHLACPTGSTDTVAAAHARVPGPQCPSWITDANWWTLHLTPRVTLRGYVATFTHIAVARLILQIPYPAPVTQLPSLGLLAVPDVCCAVYGFAAFTPRCSYVCVWFATRDWLRAVTALLLPRIGYGLADYTRCRLPVAAALCRAAHITRLRLRITQVAVMPFEHRCRLLRWTLPRGCAR